MRVVLAASSGLYWPLANRLLIGLLRFLQMIETDVGETLES